MNTQESDDPFTTPDFWRQSAFMNKTTNTTTLFPTEKFNGASDPEDLRISKLKTGRSNIN
jgi:hypothetical protein